MVFAEARVQEETWSEQEIESALAIVRQAVRNEIDGQRFYDDAARFCIDPWAKEIFATLAQEEEAHTRVLLLEYETLTKQGRWLDLQTAWSSDIETDITRLDFPEDEPVEELFPGEWSVEIAIDRRADDLSALTFGIQMEQAAIALYSQAAQETQNPAVQETYGFLVEEEIRHCDQLVSRWEELAGVPFDSSSPM